MEEDSLLSRGADRRDRMIRTPRLGAFVNFIIMCFAFGFAHGSVTIAIAYASTAFSYRLGTYSTGCVYLVYTFGSLFFASPIVDMIGSQRALSMALLFYVLYVLTLMLGTFHRIDADTDGLWVLIIIGSLLGGFGTAVGWVAQGVYFASSAALYETTKGVSDANDYFAGIFAAICRLRLLLHNP